MALRILPFRQYDDNDVINMFALQSAYVNTSTTGSSYGDAGVFVTTAVGDFNLDPITYASDSYLGKTDYPHVGVNQYPSVSLKIKPATAGDGLMGLTLRQTAQYDENGEKLLYYPQKREDLQVVLLISHEQNRSEDKQFFLSCPLWKRFRRSKELKLPSTYKS